MRRLPHAARRSTDPAAKNGKIRSHRFAAANTALPTSTRIPCSSRRCRTSCATGRSRWTCSASSAARPTRRRRIPAAPASHGKEPRLASTFAAGEETLNFGAAQNFLRQEAEVLAPLDKMGVSVRRGESVRVEVVVRTRKVGHFFPGGTVDAFDVWVELEAVDETRPGDSAQRRRGRRRQGAGGTGRALLSQPAARRARQPDQQAERVDVALRRLRPPDSARRRRHDSLPPADPRERRRAHLPARQGQLPQVRLVEHAVGVCRRARPGAA